MAKRKGRSPIGIDLQQNSAKLMQLSYGSKGPSLAAHASATFDESLLQLEDRQPEPIIDALKQAVDKHGFSGRAAVITLPPKKVDVRTLTLPGADADIQKMLAWEAESYLHYEVQQASIDYVKLGDVSVGNEKRTEVLVAATAKPYLFALLDLLAKAGLRPEVVDIVPMALCRLGAALGEQAGDGPVTLIDIGRSSTVTVIANKGALRLTRNIPRGGDEVTAKIKNNLDISLQEAELLKIEYGAGIPNQGASFGTDRELVTKTEVAGTIHEILRPDLEELAAELQKLFRYFSTQSKGASVIRGYLCGGGGKLKGLAGFLSEHTGTRIELLPALEALCSGGASTEAGESFGPEYAVAAGLALRNTADEAE